MRDRDIKIICLILGMGWGGFSIYYGIVYDAAYLTIVGAFCMISGLYAWKS